MELENKLPDNMTNLLAEVIEEISSLENIDWISVDNSIVPLDQFVTFANSCIYDSGYGLAEINMSLKIMLKDGTWLERREYDGSECFEHCRVPVKPNTVCTDVSVINYAKWVRS